MYMLYSVYFSIIILYDSMVFCCHPAATIFSTVVLHLLYLDV